MADATWLPKIFRKLREHITGAHFSASEALFHKNKVRTHAFKISDFGAGGSPIEHQRIALFLWEKREVMAQSKN